MWLATSLTEPNKTPTTQPQTMDNKTVTRFDITIKNTTDETKTVNLLANANQEQLYKGKFGIPKQFPEGVEISVTGDLNSYTEVLDFLQQKIIDDNSTRLPFFHLKCSSDIEHNAMRQIECYIYLCEHKRNGVFCAYGLLPFKYVNGMTYDATDIDVPIPITYTLGSYLSFDVLPQTQIIYTTCCLLEQKDTEDIYSELGKTL